MQHIFDASPREGRSIPSHVRRNRWRAWLAAAAVVAGGVAFVAPISTSTASAQTNSQAAARLAAVQAARGQVDAANAQLQAAATRLRATWESKPEMQRAQLELTQARAELDRVSKPAIQKLQQSDEYKRAVDDEGAAAQRVAAEQAKTAASQPAATMPTTGPAAGSVSGGLTPADRAGSVTADQTDLNIAMPSDDQVDAAVDRLAVTSKRRQMEQDAVRADPATADARARLERATAEVRALRLQMRAAALNDPEYKAAQQQLDTARAELARASASQ